MGHSALPATPQFIEHAPGPRGSPHEPHAEGAPGEGLVPFDDTAKTDSFGSSFELRHFGQSAFSLPYTRASNSWSHSLHLYSKMGINNSPEAA